MKCKPYLLGALLVFLCSFTAGHANVRDVYTVWDADELSAFQSHSKSFEAVEIPQNVSKIKIKKFKRFKIRGLYSDISFSLKNIDLTRPRFFIELKENVYSETAVNRFLHITSLRGPPALS